MTISKKSVLETKTGAVERFKFAAEAAGKITGYGSVFGNIDLKGERVVRGAFSKSIARHNAEGSAPLMLWQHRFDDVVGRWTEFYEDDYGLHIAGEANLSSSRGSDAYEHVKAGDLSGLSIGYTVIESRWNGEVRELVEVDLAEVSIVSFPANRSARIRDVKFESAIDVEAALLDAGAPRAFARKFAAAGWAAMVGGQDDHPTIDLNPLADCAEKASREIERLKGLFK